MQLDNEEQCACLADRLTADACKWQTMKIINHFQHSPHQHPFRIHANLLAWLRNHIDSTQMNEQRLLDLYKLLHSRGNAKQGAALKIRTSIKRSTDKDLLL